MNVAGPTTFGNAATFGSASFMLSNIPTMTNLTNILYYDTSSKAVSYGSVPSLTDTFLYGIPKTTTASLRTSTQQLATTEFVTNSINTTVVVSPNVNMTTFNNSGGPYTYNVPSGCLSLWIRLQGAGGGGGSTSISGGNGNSSTLSTTTGTSILNASGGFGGGVYNGGGGGVSTGGNIVNMTGNSGSQGSYTSNTSGWEIGGNGGSSTFGIGGAGGATMGGSGTRGLSGSGGGGCAGTAPNSSAGGGGAGGYCEMMINDLSGSYIINIGAGGSGGTNGGLGGDGKCVIFAYVNGYQPFIGSTLRGSLIDICGDVVNISGGAVNVTGPTNFNSKTTINGNSVLYSPLTINAANGNYLTSNYNSTSNSFQITSGITGTDYTLYSGVDKTNGCGYIQSKSMGGVSSSLYLNPQGGTVYSNTLSVTGTIYASGTITQQSDINAKKDIETIVDALDKVKRMRGVYYTMRDTNKRSLGLIAQETQQVIPEVVTCDPSGNNIGISYGNIVGLLVEAIKQSDGEIDLLKSQNNLLLLKNTNLEERLSVLEKLLLPKMV